MRDKAHVAALVALAMSGKNFMINSDNFEDDFTIYRPLPKKEIIPAGCKKYEFKINGEVVFTCIALSEKRANDKYKKWAVNNTLL